MSQLTKEIKYLLEEKYDIIWISGEISNLRVHSSGHAYFTLKDESAQISAVMFKGQLKKLKFNLDNGVSIVGMGRVSVYEPRGTYQIILEYLEPKGIGALQIAFEQLKTKLAAEGFFDASHKKALPFLPSKIGIVTSPSGAALQDILKIIHRRFDNIPIDIYPVHVQGAASVSEIAAAISLAVRQKEVDIIILARGGGSMEDLAAFNSESVARAIFSSPIPIVSAVGHETDFTIADFVADLRAPTPSAAAELVVPVKNDLIYQCKILQQRCIQAAITKVKTSLLSYHKLGRRLVHPHKRIQELQLRLDEFHQRLLRSMAYYSHWKIRQRLNASKMLLALNPNDSIAKYKAKLDIINYKILTLCYKNLNNAKQKVSHCQSSLNALSPLAVLKRGYSITRTLPYPGKIVTNADIVSLRQQLQIILHQGTIEVQVTKKHNT